MKTIHQTAIPPAFVSPEAKRASGTLWLDKAKYIGHYKEINGLKDRSGPLGSGKKFSVVRFEGQLESAMRNALASNAENRSGVRSRLSGFRAFHVAYYQALSF